MERPKPKPGRLSMRSRADNASPALQPKAPLPPEIEAAVAAAQNAAPPWERADKEPPPPEPVFPPGERLKLMRERIGYDPDLGSKFGFLIIKVTQKKEPLQSMKKFKAIRKKLEEAGSVVRDEAFDDWIMRCVVNAERPDEWTQAQPLHESYLRQAKSYGLNRADKAISKLVLATDTRFGILMRNAGFIKKRRSKGQFYPLRLKQGA